MMEKERKQLWKRLEETEEQKPTFGDLNTAVSVSSSIIIYFRKMTASTEIYCPLGSNQAGGNGPRENLEGVEGGGGEWKENP